MYQINVCTIFGSCCCVLVDIVADTIVYIVNTLYVWFTYNKSYCFCKDNCLCVKSV